MKNEVQLFKFKDQELSVITDRDDNTWFMAKNVCFALGLKNHKVAIKALDDDEKLRYKILTSGQRRDVNFISESGLYALILRSNKPEAKVFRKWVTSEVLPQIRRTGRYDPTPPEPEDLVIDSLMSRTLVISKNVVMRVIPSREHKFLVSTQEMARSLNISDSGIRVQKFLYKHTLIPGVHYFDNYPVADPNRNAISLCTVWTHRGLLWYAGHIKGGYAMDLRKWAKEEIIKHRKDEPQFMHERSEKSGLNADQDIMNLAAEACRIFAEQNRFINKLLNFTGVVQP